MCRVVGPGVPTQAIGDRLFDRTRSGRLPLLYALGFNRPINTATFDTVRDLRHRPTRFEEFHRFVRLKTR
jgi:hypothetical protein